MIGAMRSGGSTLEEILAALATAGGKVSRSALGRYTQRLDAADPAALGEVVDRLRREVAQLRLDLGAALRELLAALGRPQ